MPEWDPEVEVDVERARALIGSQFPELATASVRELAAGWDNVVHLVDEWWAFRFPRREIAVPGVLREIEILERLAPNLPLPVPEPHWIGEPSDAYPWPWFGARYLAGVELADSGLADDSRVRAGASLGRFLRRLHGPGMAARVGATLPTDPLRRADMGVRVPFARRRLETVATAGLWQPTDAVERLLEEASALPPPSRTVVVHGDLHMRHVLVDEDGEVSGIIDWGDVAIGDPAIDVSIAFGSLVGPARAAFIDTYGALDGLTELRARVIATFLAAALLGYADEQRMANLRAESLRALDRVVA